MGFTADQIAEILAACERVKAAPDYESAYAAWEPLLKVDPQQVGPGVFTNVATAYFNMVFTKKRPPEAGELALAEAVAPDDLSVYFEQFKLSIGAEQAAAEREIVERFKAGVVEFIRWSAEDDYAQGDVDVVRNAPDFATAQAVLAKYDDPALSFLSLVRVGYFV